MVFLLFFSGSNTTKTGYRPIYISSDIAKTICFSAPQAMEKQGKIYIKDQYVFIGDINLGVHIIDNTNPEYPEKIGFLKIYGNHDIAIKGNTLYADNFDDLIAVDISDIEHPVVTKREKAVYTLMNHDFPPGVPYGTYFECVDDSKGYVLSWVEAELENPKCYTTY